jgi:hypothetical protein
LGTLELTLGCRGLESERRYAAVIQQLSEAMDDEKENAGS